MRPIPFNLALQARFHERWIRPLIACLFIFALLFLGEIFIERHGWPSGSPTMKTTCVGWRPNGRRRSGPGKRKR